MNPITKIVMFTGYIARAGWPGPGRCGSGSPPKTGRGAGEGEGRALSISAHMSPRGSLVVGEVGKLVLRSAPVVGRPGVVRTWGIKDNLADMPK